VVSPDGLFGKGANNLLKKLSALLAEKWEKPYSEVCGYVNAQMSIAVVRSTHICLHGSLILTSKMSKRLPKWEDKAGLSLFRHLPPLKDTLPTPFKSISPLILLSIQSSSFWL
jgi:hypothetical protein